MNPKDKGWQERFDKLCHLTKDGKCKYWNVEAFGYNAQDLEAPLDKFFPEDVKSFIAYEIEVARQEATKEALENLRVEAYSKSWGRYDVIGFISEAISQLEKGDDESKK